MTLHQSLPLEHAGRQDPRLSGIIKLAILAVGGQGGGVLTNWIEDMARSNGYAAQATSVAGVAQRTGATVYYLEMAPHATGAPSPVFSLMPAGGDVDVMIAAEMMEAGRAIMRGFVTPDRTVLIASTHRALAVSEKMAPGDGIASSDEVIAAAEIAARRFIAADFDLLAVSNGSVISAALFGALAGSGALPFQRAAYEEAIRASGKGVAGSLRAFAAAFDVAANPVAQAAPAPKNTPKAAAVIGPARLLRDWQDLQTRCAALPDKVAEMAKLGLAKVVDYQDTYYGREYLDQLATVTAQDTHEKDWALSREAAKYIANAMVYDDIIRVADLKTRPKRFDRIRTEMRVKDANVLNLTEYFHPRAEEIVGLMPAGLGAKLAASPVWMARLDRWFGKGRRLRTDSLGSFAMLYVLGGLRRYRLRTLRHGQEVAHRRAWLDTALGQAAQNYDLAVELLRCRRLIKGYSDTHVRGHSKFDRVVAASLSIAARPDAADWCRRLREAALKDEEGRALDGAIATVASFADA
ncbi:MAG: indolepyruvate oxidoreductase subunit beta family protein [Cypionkella sp.]